MHDFGKHEALRRGALIVMVTASSNLPHDNYGGIKKTKRKRQGRNMETRPKFTSDDRGRRASRSNFPETNASAVRFLALFLAGRIRSETGPKDGEPVSTISDRMNLFRSRVRASSIIILNGPECLRSLG